MTTTHAGSIRLLKSISLRR